jgi:hypothetical protein
MPKPSTDFGYYLIVKIEQLFKDFLIKLSNMSDINLNENKNSDIQVSMVINYPDEDSDTDGCLPDLEDDHIDYAHNPAPQEGKSESAEELSVEAVSEQKENNDELPLLEDDDDELPLLVEDGENSSPGNCPFGEDCPVKIAMDNNISPRHVQGDPSIRNHINTYHRQLNFVFSREYSQMRGELDMIRFILNSSGIINSGMINDRILNAGDGPIVEEKEPDESKCKSCDNYYDHDEFAPFFMSCCAKSYCIKCVKKLKKEEKKCPSCENDLEYLKDIKLSKKEKKIGKNFEDCLICCDTMNSTQYNGRIMLDCKCKLEICISCAYKSLKDTKHVKMGSVQGIEGLVLPQHYTVKGTCPTCRQVPSNKDEIISLYGFLPPRR